MRTGGAKRRTGGCGFAGGGTAPSVAAGVFVFAISLFCSNSRRSIFGIEVSMQDLRAVPRFERVACTRDRDARCAHRKAQTRRGITQR